MDRESSRLSGLIGYAMALIAIGVFSSAALAVTPPTGGQLLQQVPAPTPAPAKPAPTIVIVRPETGRALPGEAFLVKRIEVTGSSLSPDAVRAIVEPQEGKMLTLADLQKMADDITALYQRNGFPFSRAYVPAQTLVDGLIRIAVLEAHYDGVRLRNSSRVDDFVPNIVLHALKAGEPVEQAALDRALLLVSDIPGTVVKGTLKPGQAVGTSELLVDVDRGVPLYGSVSADDYGNVATGRARANASVSFNNPLRWGDVLSVSASSAGRGMNYGSVNYALPVYGPATQVSVEASSLSYRVVYGSAVDLDSHGTARVGGVGLKQVLLRSTTVNLYGEVTFNETQLHDEIDAAQIHTDRHTEDWRASLFGGIADTTGVLNFNLSVARGNVIYDNLTAQRADDAGPRTEGLFTKALLQVSRLQQLSAKTSLYAAFDIQRADSNLDSSEQFFVGGPSSVRAYDNGLVSGSQGESLTLELRRILFAGWPGAWQGAVFVDDAHYEVAEKIFAPGPNNATLSGAGVSLNWASVNSWSVNSSIATPIGDTPEIAGRRDSLRAWISVQKGF